MVHPESLMLDMESELFNYTSGRFLANEAYCLQQRRRVFNVPGLFNIIADALNIKTEQIVEFRKLGEGGLNRVFLITEVATMCFLRSKGLPISEVYTYSFSPKNEAGTEYILMEHVKHTDLSDMWYDLKEDAIMSLMDQVAKIESMMMSIPFPAGGSIYYANDLRELTGTEGIPLDDTFCMGPDTSVNLGYGRREQLNVFRGPYKDVKSVLIAGAEKEYPFRRECYNYEKQLPSDHIKSLRRYVRLAPWLVPNNNSLQTFCIRHPDLTDNNIKVSAESGSLQIVSILDWQHTAVLPVFLNACLPAFIPVEADKLTRDLMIRPTLPENFDQLSEEEKIIEEQLFRRRLVHYHYATHTAVQNPIHHSGLTYPLNSYTRRIYIHATDMWRGETIDLLSALMQLAHHWDSLTTGATSYPVVFTKEIDAEEALQWALVDGIQSWDLLKQYTGCRDDTWVPAAEYEEAKMRSEVAKQFALECCAEKEEYTKEMIDRAAANWPFDDLNEEELGEYS